MVYNLSTGHPMSDICPICPKCGSTQIFNDECLERSQFECEITDAKGASIDGNDGFVIHADLRQKKLQMKTIIYCAFNESDEAPFASVISHSNCDLSRHSSLN